MYATARLDHYLTYATLINELRLCGQSIRHARRTANNVRHGITFRLMEPSYVSYPVTIAYNVDDSTYVATCQLSN